MYYANLKDLNLLEGKNDHLYLGWHL